MKIVSLYEGDGGPNLAKWDGYVFGCIFLNIFPLPPYTHTHPGNEVRGQRSFLFRRGGVWMGGGMDWGGDVFGFILICTWGSEGLGPGVG